MRSARIAEYILELFTDRANATATVGDLLELTAGRSDLTFWIEIAQTALSHLWRDLSTEPLYLAGLALRAVVVQLLLSIGSFVAIFIALLPVIAIARGLLHIPAKSLEPVFSWISLPIAVCSSYLLGGWIARRSHGRAIAACVGFLAMMEVGIPSVVTLVGSVTGLTERLTHWVNVHADPAYNPPDFGASSYLLLITGHVVMLIAAVRMQRKSLSASA